MNQEKVKIGGVEYTLPFKAGRIYVRDSANPSLFVADVSCLPRTQKDETALAETIAKALNRYFGYESETDKAVIEHFGD